MIAEDKMRAMSKMALFEHSKTGKEALRTARFFRNDYIRWEILKTVVSVTLGYAIVLVLVTLYHLEYLIKNATKLNYKELGLKTLGIFIVILIVYVSFTVMRSVYKYHQGRKRFLHYHKQLKALAKIYDFEENTQEGSHDTTSSDQG